MKSRIYVCFSFFLFIFLTSCPIFPPESTSGPTPSVTLTPTPYSIITPTPTPGSTLEPGLIDDWPVASILTRTSPGTYHVVSTVEVGNTACPLTQLSILIPIPQSNMYQDISNINIHSGVELIIPETSDKYARYFVTSGLPGPGESITFSLEYDVTIYTIHAATESVTVEYPYDTGSDIYQYYRGNSGNLVDITYSEIQTIGDTLWAQSTGLLDYAYRCYEYVALNFNYLNPNTGLHDISTLFTDGGGDCGNLSSIFISLLRYKDIPARHLITVRPNGSLHAWADFYLEGYGWIPADVTFAQGDADGDGTIDGDYFGDVAVATNGIIMTKEVFITVHRGDTEVNINLLQSYGWWYWRQNDPCTMTSDYSIIATSK